MTSRSCRVMLLSADTAIKTAWLTVNAILFWREYTYYSGSPRFHYLHGMLGGGLCVSRASASLINLNVASLLIPMCRCVLSYCRQARLTGRTIRVLIDKCKMFHQLCAFLVAVSSVVHFIGHYFNAVSYSQCYSVSLGDLNAARYPMENPLLILARSVPGVTGLLLTLSLAIIVITSIRQVRKHHYNIFWYCHKLYFIFIAVILIHAYRGILKEQVNLDKHIPGCGRTTPSNTSWPAAAAAAAVSEAYLHSSIDSLATQPTCVEEPIFNTIGSSSWMWIAGPLIVFASDAIYRSLSRHHRPGTVVGVKIHPGHVAELQIRKEIFTCTPGQFVFIRCPEIAALEWHPFSVSCCPSGDDPAFSLHVRWSNRDWSGKLIDYITRNIQDDCDESPHKVCNNRPLRIFVDGPYASPLEELLNYPVSLCIAGGIGITPFVSFLDYYFRRSCVNDLRNKSFKPKRVRLVWVVRNVQHYEVFAAVINDVSCRLWEANRPDLLDVDVHITGGNPFDTREFEDRHRGFLAGRIFLGRPSWSDVFARMKMARDKRHKIGVFSCGPKSLNDEIENCSQKDSSHADLFDFYHESL